MNISWDESKRAINIQKHGYDLAGLEEAFDGRFALTRSDNRKDYGETRNNMLTEIHGRIVNVTFTPRNEQFHLISARPASLSERRAYNARRGSKKD